MRVAAVIPAYNEAELILETVTAVREIAEVDEIVVVNDGSTDGTAAAVSRLAGVTLLNLRRNLGKGGALNEGWRHTAADIYLFLDADLGRTASLGRELVRPVLAGRADLTVARFATKQAGAGKMGFGFARRLACLGVRALTGQSVTSPLSGQRALTHSLLKKLGGVFPGFGAEIGLTVGALKGGYRVLEIPLAMQHRAYGRGIQGFRHRGRQLMHVLRALYRCWRKDK